MRTIVWCVFGFDVSQLMVCSGYSLAIYIYLRPSLCAALARLQSGEQTLTLTWISKAITQQHSRKN